MGPGRYLVFVEVSHHRHIGRAEHEDHELAGDVGAQVRRLVVHDIKTRLPERFTRLDRVRPLPFELKEDLLSIT